MNPIQYVVSDGGAHIAYRVLDGPDPAPEFDIVMVSGGVVPMEVFDEEAGLARLLEGLQAIAPVIVFDRRGVGASDPITDWEQPVLEQWAEDTAAVVEKAARDRAVVFAWDTFGVGTRYAATVPDKLERLVLFQPRGGANKAWTKWAEDRLAAVRSTIGRNDDDLLAELAPSRAADPAFRDWYERAGRVGASPATADRVWVSVFGSLNEDQHLERISVPTLVLVRPDTRLFPAGSVESVAAEIPNSAIARLDGEDAWPFVGDVDAVIAEISDFLVGERRVPAPDRTLAAVLFTDLVDSTKRAAALGDAQWKSLLDRHDLALRSAVGRCGGTVVKTTGDGILATFPSATAAVRAADRLRRDVNKDGLEVRIGIHVGDVDQRGEDISGLAVNIAARVMSKAGNGEIFATGSVAASVAGQGSTFEPVGSYELKGVPGDWELFRIAGTP